MGVGFLLRRRPGSYSALAAVEGHVRFVIHDDCAVHVDISDYRGVHVHHSGVVEEMAFAPFAAIEAVTAVSKSVINAAIESDLRSPVAGIPNVKAVVPTPVARGPQIAGFGRFYPRAGHPVVAVIVIPSPVTGRPHIAVAGADRLLVDGQWGRTDPHRNAYAANANTDSNLSYGGRGESCGKNQQQKSKHKNSNCTGESHNLVTSSPVGLSRSAAPPTGEFGSKKSGAEIFRASFWPDERLI